MSTTVRSNDLLPCLVILEATEKILLYSVDHLDAKEFYLADDQMRFNASLLLLSTIGEYSTKISVNLKKDYPVVNWIKIKGLRNRIVHDYTGIDYEMVFFIISKEIRDLKHNIQTVIKNELKKGNFKIEEIDVARSSYHYRHIDFSSFT